MKKNASIRFVYLLALFIFSCRCNKGFKIGGPCTYDTKFYPATVIEIKKIDSLNADLIFRINDNEGKLYRDSVSWYKEKNSWVKASFARDSVAIGQKLKYQVDVIKKGTCTPQIEELLLEKY